jgi:UDPglucose--hexose-1-phosphate uridylyltransferase
MTAPSQGPHRRFNPLLDEWVLCSPQRLSRPWQGRTEAVATSALPAYDPACYLCPGNERAEGARNPDYEATFVFDNDFPALTLDAPDPASPDPLLRAEPAPGICRVVCFSPRHDLTLARMEATAIGRVIEAWAEQVVELEGRLQQPPPTRSDLGDGVRARNTGPKARHPAALQRAARP